MIRIPYLREAGALIAAALVAYALWTAYNFAYNNGYNAANVRAEQVIAEFARAEAEARKQAAERDDLSATATTEARDTTADQLADHNTRAERVRTLVREVTVPAVCPDPDPQLMQELRAGESRVRAAASRLSDQRRPASAAAADPRTDG